MSRRRMRVPERLVCPCCGQRREVDPRASPLRQETELTWREKVPFSSQAGWTVELAKGGHLVWACDACVRGRRALAAKPWLQTYCCSPPRFAYFDRSKVCGVCGAAFVFTAREQQLWYEEYKLSVDAEPVACPRCRRAKKDRARVQAELADALHDGEPRGPEQLVRIANLYLAAGSARKAAEFLRRAKNLCADPAEVARLLDRIAEVEGREGSA